MKREPIVLHSIDPERRTRLLYEMLQSRHTQAEILEWSDDRYALEILRLNPEFHRHGFHAEFIPGRNELRLQVLVIVADVARVLREARGTAPSDEAIVERFLGEFPDARAEEIDFDGRPELCILGTWSKVTFI